MTVQGKRNVTYIWGPKGSGKTTLAKNIALNGNKVMTYDTRFLISSTTWKLCDRLNVNPTVIFEDTCKEDFDLKALLDLMNNAPLTRENGEPIMTKNVIIVSQYPPERFVDGPLQPTFLASIDRVVDVVAERERQIWEEALAALDRARVVATTVAFPQVA